MKYGTYSFAGFSVHTAHCRDDYLPGQRTVVSFTDPMRNLSLMLFPGRTELVTLVKTGSRAGRTHSQ